MASSVATPLERQFGRIAGVTEMTSTSSLGSTSIVLQFDLNRNIDAAARDVQAAINAARGQLPTNLPSNPTYRKVNPADAPIMILGADLGHRTTAARCTTRPTRSSQQKLSQVEGVGQVTVGGGALPGGARRAESDAAEQLRPRSRGRAHCSGQCQREPAQGRAGQRRTRPGRLSTTDQLLKAERVPAADRRLHNGAAVRLVRRRARDRFGGGHPHRRAGQRQAGRADHHLPPARREHHRHGGPRLRRAAAVAGFDSRRRST